MEYWYYFQYYYYNYYLHQPRRVSKCLSVWGLCVFLAPFEQVVFRQATFRQPSPEGSYCVGPSSHPDVLCLCQVALPLSWRLSAAWSESACCMPYVPRMRMGCEVEVVHVGGVARVVGVISPVAIIEKKQRCCNTTIAAKKLGHKNECANSDRTLRFLLPSPLDYVGVLAHSVLNVSTEDLVLFRLSLNTQMMLLFAMRESFSQLHQRTSIFEHCVHSLHSCLTTTCSSTCASTCILKISDSEATMVVLECWCDGNGDFFYSGVGLPTPSAPEGGPSHSDGIKYDRVEPGAPSAPTNQGRWQHLPIHLRTATCARFFKQNRQQNTIHKNRVCRSRTRLHLC